MFRGRVATIEWDGPLLTRAQRILLRRLEWRHFRGFCLEASPLGGDLIALEAKNGIRVYLIPPDLPLRESAIETIRLHLPDLPQSDRRLGSTRLPLWSAVVAYVTLLIGGVV